MSIARSVAPFAGLTAPLWAQSVALPYNTQYSIVDLGTPPGVPPNNGGLVVMAGDPNYLLIGGAANQATGAIYQIRLVRNDSNHIIGFSGTATRYANGPNNDGGLAYGPGNVLFFTRYPVHELGQIKPGSTVVDRSVPLGPLGYSSSVGACTFVPSGFPQAGRLKLASYNGGRFHDATVSPDGNGTFNVSAATAGVSIGGGPEGIAYIPPGSPLFTDYTSLLVCEYGSGAVVVYDVNANADPIVTTRRLFITGLSGAEGAAIDPATGDFLFSTYRGSNRVLVVRGFGSPCASFLNYGTGLAGSGGLVPGLFGSGCAARNLTIAFNVSNGSGGAPGLLLISDAQASIPAFGGTILVNPLLFVPHVLAGSGAGNGTFSVPTRIPDDASMVGTDFYAQCAYIDFGAVQQISFTAGLTSQIR